MAAVVIDICLPSLSYPWSLIPPLVVMKFRSMFVIRWRSNRPRTHTTEKDFVLGRILNSPFVIFTPPFVWLPLQSEMGLLGQICILGWATGPINLTLIILVTNRPPQYVLVGVYVCPLFLPIQSLIYSFEIDTRELKHVHTQ